MKTRKLLLFAVCLLLAACNMPQNPASGARAWIDAPLDKSTLPMAPYEVIFHAYAPGNPAAVQFSINGQNVEMGSVDLSQPLVTVHYQWKPDHPGQYILMASSQDGKGNWSSPYIHTVMIVASTSTPTQTLTSTVTSTPTWTRTPQRRPTKTPTLTPTAVLGISVLSKSADQFYFGLTHCGVMAVTLEVKVSDPAVLQGVTFYMRLEDKVTKNHTAWNSGTEMHAEGNGKFTITVISNTIPQYSTYSHSVFQYQFIGTDSNFAVIYRSPVFSDISLSMCGVL